jgi:outer membrane lipoprotein-sorting protein
MLNFFKEIIMKLLSRNTKNALLLSLLCAGIASNAQAQTPEERGLEIATQVQAQDDGFIDSQSAMTMTLINRSGKKSSRRIRSRVLEVPGDGDKSMSIFDEPADVKGTASLTHSHAVEADEQWLYLPALKRVKRISSKNKSGPFMGSEFAFEDISSQEVDKYSYKYLGDDALDGGSNIDTAIFSGNAADYTITQTSLGVFEVVGADGTDTLTASMSSKLKRYLPTSTQAIPA